MLPAKKLREIAVSVLALVLEAHFQALSYHWLNFHCDISGSYTMVTQGHEKYPYPSHDTKRLSQSYALSYLVIIRRP